MVVLLLLLMVMLLYIVVVVVINYVSTIHYNWQHKVNIVISVVVNRNDLLYTVINIINIILIVMIIIIPTQMLPVYKKILKTRHPLQLLTLLIVDCCQ